MRGLGASEIHLKGRVCRVWVFCEEKQTSNTCVNKIARERRVRCALRKGWLAAWSCCSALGDGEGLERGRAVFKGKRKDFCVMQWAAGVPTGSNLDVGERARQED